MGVALASAAWRRGSQRRGPGLEAAPVHGSGPGRSGDRVLLRREQRGNGKGRRIKLTVGQLVADKVATTMGSWTFIIIQSVILLFWIILNVTAYVQRWDPYPFILLNLVLSFQAAYAAPFIMMSQNRQQDIDRRHLEDRQFAL